MLLQASSALAQGPPGKWVIPPEAKTEKSTVKPSADVLKKGKGAYDTRCARCHGPEGQGNGPDARRNAPPADLAALNLTDNPDGVLYYKVWNGQPPKMPAFKTLMTKDDVWAVVHYTKSLRKKG